MILPCKAFTEGENCFSFQKIQFDDKLYIFAAIALFISFVHLITPHIKCSAIRDSAFGNIFFGKDILKGTILSYAYKISGIFCNFGERRLGGRNFITYAYKISFIGATDSLVVHLS